MKKKVVHIVESFGSGVFSFLVDLVNGTSEDFDITIAYGIREETLENFEQYFNGNVKFTQVKNFTRSINPVKDLKALKEVKNIIKKEKPDIVHLHSSKAGIIGRVAVNGSKVKMFYNPHGFSFLKQDDSKLKRKIYKIIEKTAAIINKKCTIVGCSNGEYEEAKKINKNSICINNGINIEEMNKNVKTFEENRINYDNIKICTVGRIGYQKNPELFNKIAEEFPDIQFTWIGEGSLRDKLTSPNITITGWKTRKETLEIMNEHDVFILGSLWEGLPLSLLEAMYLRKICIVSNCIGNRDVILNNKNGFVASNYEEYIKIIKNIRIHKKNSDIVENAYKDVQNIYNTNRMIKSYKDAYGVKKTILHIVNSNIFSGLEKVSIEIIKNLESKYDFYYVTKDGSILEKLEKENIKRIKINKMSAKEIRRICKKYRPDILHAHDYRATIVTALSFVNVPIISHLHNNSPWIKNINLYTIALLIASFRCEEILTVSDSIEKEYIFSNVIHNKIHNIGNPLSVEKIVNKVPKNVKKEYDICFSGRLTKQKNPIKFIHIIEKVKQKIPNIIAIVLGDGELKEECNKEIERLNLQENIILKGFQSNPYIYMAKSRVFCLTSDWEGFGLVAFEALAMGMPCIVSNVGGLPTIVNEKCGMLVETEKQFEEAIIEILLKKEYINMEEFAIERAKKLDNYKQYMSLIENIYEREK